LFFYKKIKTIVESPTTRQQVKNMRRKRIDE